MALPSLNSHPRRLVAAAAIATLLGVAALLSLSPAPASAGYGSCDPGDFCLYYDATAKPAGGIYHFSGSDSSLRNDRFELHNTNQIVANNTASAWVNGYAAAKDDVIVYRSTGWRGGATCLRRGDKGMLPFDVLVERHRVLQVGDGQRVPRRRGHRPQVAARGASRPPRRAPRPRPTRPGG